MDILDRLLGHDAWTTRQLLLRCRELSDEQLDRRFDIAHRSVRATFLHLIRNMEVWTDPIADRPIRKNENDEPTGRSANGLLRRLDAVAADLAAACTRIVREGRLDECFVDHLDNPPRKKPYGGAIVHIITQHAPPGATLVHATSVGRTKFDRGRCAESGITIRMRHKLSMCCPEECPICAPMKTVISLTISAIWPHHCP